MFKGIKEPDLKRYLSVSFDLPYFIQKQPRTIHSYIEAFKISRFKNNGKVCIKANDLIYLQKCVKLKEESGMNLKAISKLSEMRIRQLIKEI